jgi:hypothetical protein
VTDSADTSGSEAPGAGAQPVAASSSAPWSPPPSAQESIVGIAAEHPELMLGAAFAGGLVVAMILKRLAG